MDRIVRTALTIALLAAAVPVHAEDRSVFLAGPVGIVQAGSSFTVDVLITNTASAINAAEITLTFPPERFRVEQVDRDGSAFTLWPDPPAWDNVFGTVHASGGLPNGLFAKDARIFDVRLTALTTGSGDIALDGTHSGVFLNDSRGTRLELPAATRSIDVASELAPTIGVTSRTHPSADRWYPHRTVELTWKAEPDWQYSYAFGPEPALAPDDVPDDSLGPLTYANLPDGRYAFTIKGRPPGNPWTPITQRTFRIDGTVPEPFLLTHPDPAAVEGSQLLTWTATDRTAGVDRSELSVNGRAQGTVESPLVIRPSWFGKTVTVTVLDAAGNSREESLALPASHARAPYWALGAVIVVLAGGVWILRRRA